MDFPSLGHVSFVMETGQAVKLARERRHPALRSNEGAEQVSPPSAGRDRLPFPSRSGPHLSGSQSTPGPGEHLRSIRSFSSTPGHAVFCCLGGECHGYEVIMTKAIDKLSCGKLQLNRQLGAQKQSPYMQINIEVTCNLAFFIRNFNIAQR